MFIAPILLLHNANKGLFYSVLFSSILDSVQQTCRSLTPHCDKLLFFWSRWTFRARSATPRLRWTSPGSTFLPRWESDARVSRQAGVQSGTFSHFVFASSETCGQHECPTDGDGKEDAERDRRRRVQQLPVLEGAAAGHRWRAAGFTGEERNTALFGSIVDVLRQQL